MANLDWNVYRNPAKVGEGGEYGVDYWGVRHPDTHTVVFSDSPASGDKPSQDAGEFLEGIAPVSALPENEEQSQVEAEAAVGEAIAEHQGVEEGDRVSQE